MSVNINLFYLFSMSQIPQYFENHKIQFFIIKLFGQAFTTHKLN